MKIEINNLTGSPVLSRAVDKRVFSTVAKIVFKGENRKIDTLSLAFVVKEEIKKLNKKFREKNKATDVLSFEINEKDVFGEIVICPEIVKENAKKYGVTYKTEMIRMFIHGILHLCGYDHEKSLGQSTGEAKKEEKIMQEKQEKYLSLVN